MGRYSLLVYTGIFSAITFILLLYYPFVVIFFLPSFILFSIAIYDFLQKKKISFIKFSIVWKDSDFFLESIRPELRQYYWESDDDELPYSRNQRTMVYERAKNVGGVRPFGSLEKMYNDDFVWLNHSIQPSNITVDDFKTKVGIGKNSYLMSVLNISGTSFGAMSPPAIESLNKSAKIGKFAHNTGEGALSKYHEAGGGDLIWQISTGYFGCRTKNGNFCKKQFSKKSKN